jgi:predicted dienelactone hydrolase
MTKSPSTNLSQIDLSLAAQNSFISIQLLDFVTKFLQSWRGELWDTPPRGGKWISPGYQRQHRWQPPRASAGMIMRHAALILPVLVWTQFAVAETVGVRDVAISVPERNAVLHANVWYPATTGGDAVLVGDNAVFRGTPGSRDAPVREGHFPLILVAHGGFRSASDVASWLASALASSGFIVVVMRPPPVPNGPAEQSVLAELWLRPGDLSAAISAVEKEPSLAAQIDPEEVGAVGFFLGGYTALSLAGARVDPEAFAHSCEGSARSLDCTWFAKGGVNLHLVDAARLGRSNLDPRLKVGIVVDPELTGSLTSQSLRAIAGAVHVINLGAPKEIPSALDASELASKIPGARYSAIQDAAPFSSFAECKPKGPAILEIEGGEVQLCDDGNGQSRVAIHRQIADTILEDLRQAFRSH